MQDELRKSLLTKKSLPFQKLHQQCLIKLQRIKQKNDFIQRQVGVEVEQDMKMEVKKQKQFLEREIKEIKELMIEMNNRFKDPQSRNKLKSIKAEAQKQIQRNKVILKDLISKSFLARSIGEGNPQEDMDQYMEGGKVHYADFGDQNNDPNFKKDSLLTEDHREIQIDYEIERKILEERNQMLNEVEQSTMRVNEIMGDVAIMINEQGENLDIISDQLIKTHKNVTHANQAMQEASTLQKKSRKKYIIFALIIILLVIGVVGVVFILSR